MTNIAVSPCSNPQFDLATALREYAALGYRKFEAFTSWAKSALDWREDAGRCRALAASHGMAFSSMHLPPVRSDEPEATLEEAVRAARFAHELGAPVVLFKASDRPTYVSAAAFLDAIDGLGLTPVLQNHAGSPISSAEDFREVIEGIGDPRMKTLLEVGHFHAVGVSWPEGYELLGDSVALVHIKDMVGARSVPFGTGEVDLPGLFAHMKAAGYRGDFVVEMEVADKENTLAYLADARRYLRGVKGADL